MAKRSHWTARAYVGRGGETLLREGPTGRALWLRDALAPLSGCEILITVTVETDEVPGWLLHSECLGPDSREALRHDAATAVAPPAGAPRRLGPGGES